MKGENRLVEKLNDLLAEELTAINQYMVHSEMASNWGYYRLHDAVEKRAIQEMRHAEKLIERIIFLEGSPTVSKLNPIHIGQDIPQQFQSDLESEMLAIRLYNEAIHLSNEVSDAVTREVLESIVKEEDAHVDWLEQQRDQISQMNLPFYLAEQMKQN
jgi:bacterioferritin